MDNRKRKHDEISVSILANKEQHLLKHTSSEITAAIHFLNFIKQEVQTKPKKITLKKDKQEKQEKPKTEKKQKIQNDFSIQYGEPNEFNVRMVKGFQLLAFQADFIRWVIEREQRLVTNAYFDPFIIGYILAIIMGGGKSVGGGTICMITLDKQRALKQPSIIITEKTLIGSFNFELYKFFGDQIRVLIYHRDYLKTQYGKFVDFENYDIIITTYATIESRFKSAGIETKKSKKVVEDTQMEDVEDDIIKDPVLIEIAKKFCQFEWYRIILDESHRIRNESTQTFRVVSMLRSKIKMCMTGTLIHNGIKDLYAQLKFVGLRLPKGIKKTEQALKDFKLYDMIKFVTKIPITLPLKTVSMVFYELSPEERFLHNHFLTRAKVTFHTIKSEKPNTRYIETQSGLTRILQVCTAPYLITKASKLDSNAEDMVKQEEVDSFPDNPDLDKWIRNRESDAGIFSSKMKAFVHLISQTQHKKTIVFANWTSSLRLAIDSLIKACPAFKSRIVFVHGKIRDTAARDALFDKFRKDPECTHLFLTLKVGGCGLNLVEANVIVFLEHWYNQAMHQQAESRAYRIGQLNPVEVYYILGKDTMEERVHAIAQDKLRLSQQVNGDFKAESDKSIGLSEFELLLS
jgi:SNF2 family DNA or RNA helicase